MENKPSHRILSVPSELERFQPKKTLFRQKQDVYHRKLKLFYQLQQQNAKLQEMIKKKEQEQQRLDQRVENLIDQIESISERIDSAILTRIRRAISQNPEALAFLRADNLLKISVRTNSPHSAESLAGQLEQILFRRYTVGSRDIRELRVMTRVGGRMNFIYFQTGFPESQIDNAVNAIVSFEQWLQNSYSTSQVSTVSANSQLQDAREPTIPNASRVREQPPIQLIGRSVVLDLLSDSTSENRSPSQRSLSTSVNNRPFERNDIRTQSSVIHQVFNRYPDLTDINSDIQRQPQSFRYHDLHIPDLTDINSDIQTQPQSIESSQDNQKEPEEESQ